MNLSYLCYLFQYHILLLAANATGISRLTRLLALLVYAALAAIAIWGAYCVIIVWMRVSQKRFESEEEHEEFLDSIDANMAKGDYAGIEASLEDDMRAMPQLTLVAIGIETDSNFSRRFVTADRPINDSSSQILAGCQPRYK